MRDDFGIFVLSHGRPDLVDTTLSALAETRYSGKWWIVLDTEDETAPEYAARWGADRLLFFDKDTEAQTFDLADNSDGPRSVIVYARNASGRLAVEQGLTYYMQLDDDYVYFAHRMERDRALTYARSYHLDAVLDEFIDFLDCSGALTVAFAQGGDFIGGAGPSWYRYPARRKAMNTFIARADRPLRFTGRINEDVNTYVLLGSRGDLFLTLTDFAVSQVSTQQQGGGMTGVYLDSGTYVKSFYTVMHAPSCVKIGTIGGGVGDTAQRVHHHITWNNAVPKIIPGALRKTPA